jgi:hypothetical protein
MITTRWTEAISVRTLSDELAGLRTGGYVTLFSPAPLVFIRPLSYPGSRSKEKSPMLMPIATYSCFAQAGRTSAHIGRVDVATRWMNVTLAERHAR